MGREDLHQEVRPGWSVSKLKHGADGSYYDVSWRGKRGPFDNVGYIRLVEGRLTSSFQPRLYQGTMPRKTYRSVSKALDAIIRAFMGQGRYQTRTRNPSEENVDPYFTSDDRFETRDVPRVSEAWFKGREAKWKTVTLAGARGAVKREDGVSLVKYTQKQPTGRGRTMYAYSTGRSASNPQDDLTGYPFIIRRVSRSRLFSGGPGTGYVVAHGAGPFKGARITRTFDTRKQAKEYALSRGMVPAGPGVTAPGDDPYLQKRNRPSRSNPKGLGELQGLWERRRATSKLPKRVSLRFLPFPKWKAAAVDPDTGETIRKFTTHDKFWAWLDKHDYVWAWSKEPPSSSNPYVGDSMSAPYYLVHPDGRIEPRAYQDERAANNAAWKLGDVTVVQGTQAEIREQYGSPPARKRLWDDIGVHSNPRRGRTRARRSSNPHSSASDLYSEFHGKPSTGYTSFKETLHEHEWLSELGILTELEVKTPSGVRASLEFPTNKRDQVLVTSSEDGKQLYFVGGDQEVPLAKLKLSGKKWKRDLMVLGRLHKLTYRTQKGFDQFETIDYYHKLGEVTGECPILLYDHLNKTLSMAGGQYEVRPEGIVN